MPWPGNSAKPLALAALVACCVADLLSGQNVANVTGTIDGLYPASGSAAAQNGGMSTSGPVTFSALLTACTFTVSFDILPGAKPFVVQAVCAASTATINIDPQKTWQATYVGPSSAARQWNFSGDGFVVTDFLTGSSFPNNQIPLSRVDPLAVSAVNNLPLPTTPSSIPAANSTWMASGTLPQGGHFTIGASSSPGPAFGGYINLSSAGAYATSLSLTVDGQLVASKQISYAAGAPQTISFPPLSNQPLGAAPFSVSAKGGASGNPVTFTSITTNVCTVSGTTGSTVTVIAAGTCTIQANQAYNAIYAPATPVTQSFIVVAPPVISQSFNATSIALGATVSLGVTITNPNAATALTGVGLSDTLPAGITVAGGSSSVCGGQFATNAPATIGLTGATISGASACSFSVIVTGAAAGNYIVTSNAVTSTNGGTGNTASAQLSVALPLPPAITGYSPTSVAAGSAAFTLTLSGSNFCAGSQVMWNTSNLATTYASPTSISATVPAALTTSATTASVSVVNSLRGCAVAGTSPAISFVVGAVSSPASSPVAVQPPLFRPSAPAGSTAPVMNSINIRNVNGTPLTGPVATQVFTVSGGANWLSVIPQTASDLNGGILRFTTNPTGLAQGSYLGYIVYPGLGANAHAAGSDAKPRAVSPQCSQVSTAVVFTVGTPTLTFNPLNPMVSATTVENIINVTVNALSGQSASQPLPMQITATTSDGAGAPCWLSIAPLNLALQTGMAFQATASTANLPAATHIGGLTVQAAGQTASDAIVFQNAAPAQQYLDAGTNPVITIDPNTLTGSIHVTSVPASLPLPITATCIGCGGASMTAMCGGTICSSSAGQIGGITPADLTVTITDLSLFNPGQASLTFSSPLAQSVTVPVTLGPLMLVNDGIVTSGQTRLAVPGAGAAVTVTVASGCPWLAAAADSLFTPLTVNLSVNPAGLAVGTYTCSLLVTPAGAGSPVTVPVSLNLQATTVTQAIIPQIADGFFTSARWTTTITLVNLDSSPAAWNLTFYGSTGGPLNLGWTDQPMASNVRTGILQAGGTQTLQTNGANPSLAEGWAQLTSANRVSGNAIFAWNGQEAAVPMLRTTQSTQYFPFDNNPGLSLGVAIAVPQGSSASETATWSTRNQNGGALTSPQTIALAANGYDSFNVPVVSTVAVNLRGVAEFDALTDPAFALGIRGRMVGSKTAFTSIEALYTQPDTVQTISHVADGATWKTTIVLVNTDSVPAAYTVNFWRDDGTAFTLPMVDGSTASTVRGTIPVGGSATIESTGAATALTSGWAEVLSGQSVGGTAVFQYQATGQEAAVPFLSSGGNRLVFPFDTTNNLALGIALANPSLNTGASVTMTILDSQGNRLGSTSTIAIPSHGHYAGNPVIPLNQRGTIEFDSPNVPIYGLGIRFNAGAFTSIRGLPK